MQSFLSMPRRFVVVFLIGALTCAFSLESQGARYVKAEISLDGKVVLEGSTGDAGREDADEVWEYLKEIKFKETEAFAALQIKVDDSNQAVLLSTAPKGEPGTIGVDIRYGGRTTTRELNLRRVPRDKYGRQWQLDPTQVDQLFDRRFIRRSDAARLKNPSSTRR